MNRCINNLFFYCDLKPDVRPADEPKPVYDGIGTEIGDSSPLNSCVNDWRSCSYLRNFHQTLVAVCLKTE